MQIKTLFNPAHQTASEGEGLLSGRKAAEYLRLSDNVFFPAARSGLIFAQSRRRDQNRWKFDFMVDYLDEVNEILPKERRKGLVIFTDEVVAKLEVLRKKWDGKENVDWKKDAADTDRAMKEIKKRRKK